MEDSVRDKGTKNGIKKLCIVDHLFLIGRWEKIIIGRMLLS